MPTVEEEKKILPTLFVSLREPPNHFLKHLRHRGLWIRPSSWRGRKQFWKKYALPFPYTLFFKTDWYKETASDSKHGPVLVFSLLSLRASRDPYDRPSILPPSLPSSAGAVMARRGGGRGISYLIVQKVPPAQTDRPVGWHRKARGNAVVECRRDSAVQCLSRKAPDEMENRVLDALHLWGTNGLLSHRRKYFRDCSSHIGECRGCHIGEKFRHSSHIVEKNIKKKGETIL